MGSIFRYLLPYQHQGPIPVPVGPHSGIGTLVLDPGQASDWPICMNVYVLPIHELETCCRYRCGPGEVYECTHYTVCVLLSCLLFPKESCQPEA